MLSHKRAGLILLLTAATVGALLYGWRLAPTAVRGQELPGLLLLAPADATFVFYVDLAALRASPLINERFARAPAPQVDPEYAEFARATGFDYARDLDRLMVVSRPAVAASRVITLAEGRFDREKIVAYALRTGRREQQNGLAVYVIPANANHKELALAFLQPDRLVLAEGASLAPVFAASTDGGLDPEMRERITRVSGSAAFAVGQVPVEPEKILPGLRSDQFSNLLRGIRWFSLAARAETDRLMLAAAGECDAPEQARQLAGTLDGLRLLGEATLADPRTRQRLEPQAAAGLDQLLRQIQISQDDRQVRIAVELTREMIDRLPLPPTHGQPTR